MTYARLTAAGIGLALLAASPAFAQMANGSMTSDHMANGAMTSGHMSKADMAMMKRCQKMSHTAMMKSKSCAKMMKAHPDMMKDGMMAH